MRNRQLVSAVVRAALVVLSSLAVPALAQDAPMGQNVKDMKLGPFPGLPTCATGSVQNGDPSKGPAILFAKMKAGCVFPWHWHTPNEHLMMVSGTGHMDMRDGKPLTLQPGAFARMPSKHVHQFKCPNGCSLYIYSDGVFDMHYVDDAGQELTPEAALKAVKETPGAPPAAPK